MTVHRCPTCDRVLEIRPLVSEAERGAARSFVEGAPLLVCPAGDDVEQPDPAMPEAVVAEVRTGLLVAARRPLPWRPQRCGACREPLTMPGRRTTRSVTVAGVDGPPFTVTLDLPLLRCTECAAENLPREVWPDVEAATLAALREGGPKEPPGAPAGPG